MGELESVEIVECLVELEGEDDDLLLGEGALGEEGLESGVVEGRDDETLHTLSRLVSQQLFTLHQVHVSGILHQTLQVFPLARCHLELGDQLVLESHCVDHLVDSAALVGTQLSLDLEVFYLHICISQAAG